MANLKSLAKDTAIYGLSSIAARFVNYLLVPIQTTKFNAAGGQYGIITNVYAYVALLIVLLTYGMETTFFRFMSKEGEDPNKVYATTLKMVGTTSVIFMAIILLFNQPIANFLGYADHPEYITIMYMTVAIDAFAAIPFAYLRCKHRPIKFAVLKILNISLNIVLNLLYLIILPSLKLNLFGIYDAHFTLDVVWVFYINLICTIITLLLLWKELYGIRYSFDKSTCKRMLSYTFPLLIMGLAGQLNQCASQIIFPYVYNALLAFLTVMGYMDVLRHVVGRSYWDGLEIVPIVMAAEIMFGIFFNLSFWYKLTDRTIWGAYFSGVGAVVLIAMNILLIPSFSYWACAWAGFVSYAVSMIISYYFGQKYYPIAYPLKEILFYVVVALALFAAITASNKYIPSLLALVVNTALILVFVGIIVKRDFPLGKLPIIGKRFRK